MRQRRHTREGARSGRAKRVLACSLVGAAVTALLLLGFSAVLTVRDIPHSAAEPMALAAAVLGCMAAGFLCARLSGRGGLLHGLLCGLVVFVIVCGAGMAALGGSPGWLLGIKLVIFLLSGAIGGVLGINTRAVIK